MASSELLPLQQCWSLASVTAPKPEALVWREGQAPTTTLFCLRPFLLVLMVFSILARGSHMSLDKPNHSDESYTGTVPILEHGYRYLTKH